jgi:hypothetical protein
MLLKASMAEMPEAVFLASANAVAGVRHDSVTVDHNARRTSPQQGMLSSSELLEQAKTILRCIEWEKIRDHRKTLMSGAIQGPGGGVLTGGGSCIGGGERGDNDADEEVHQKEELAKLREELSRPLAPKETIDYFMSHR